MQQKMAAGESPAAEMIKSVSLIIAGLLLVLPGFSPISSVFFFYYPGAKTSDDETAATFTFFAYAWRWF